MQRLSNSRPAQNSLQARADTSLAARTHGGSAGPSYLRRSTKPTGVISRPLRKVNSEMHFPVGFGPATSRELAASPSITFAGKISHWTNTAMTQQAQNVTTAARLLNFADQTGAESLDMRGLRLTPLPNCLYKLNSLKESNLSNNRSGKIALLPKFLTSLDLRKNEAV